MALSDLEFEKFQSGDKTVFEKIYYAYKDWVYTKAYWLLQRNDEADDVTAETLIQLWERRAEIKEIKHVEPFLYVVTRNQCLNILRQRSHHQNSLHRMELPEILDPYLERIDSKVVSKFLASILDEIGKLSLQQQEAIHLYLIKGLSLRETGRVMDINAKTVHTYVSRAKKLLDAKLKKQGIDLFISLLLIGICGIFFKILLRV